MQPIFIASVNSKVGAEAAAQLIAGGYAVRGGVRKPSKPIKGVETVQADLDQPETLISALAGIETAILTTAADIDQAAQHSRFLSAAKEAGVKRIVRISVVGSALDSPHFLARSNAESERAFSESGIEATHLRPHSFMQNFLGQVGAMRATGKIFSNTGEGQIPFVDVRDIAAAAAAVATHPEFGGKTYEITGPEALTGAEVASKFSRALGIAVEFVDVPEAAVAQGMAGAGLPEWLAKDLAALNSDFARGLYVNVSPHVQQLSGRAAFDFDSFLYKNAALL
ncbi:MAG: NmrA family NAD(P)-binding protein [Bryobacteraceae bacterium]